MWWSKLHFYTHRALTCQNLLQCNPGNIHSWQRLSATCWPFYYWCWPMMWNWTQVLSKVRKEAWASLLKNVLQQFGSSSRSHPSTWVQGSRRSVTGSSCPSFPPAATVPSNENVEDPFDISWTHPLVDLQCFPQVENKALTKMAGAHAAEGRVREGGLAPLL